MVTEKKYSNQPDSNQRPKDLRKHYSPPLYQLSYGWMQTRQAEHITRQAPLLGPSKICLVSSRKPVAALRIQRSFQFYRSKMSKTLINKDLFLARATKFYETWNELPDFSDVDCLYVLDNPNYSKSNTFQHLLFAYELADVLSVFTKKGIYFLGSNKKAQFFDPVASDEARGVLPPVKVLLRNKEDKDKANFETIINFLKENGIRKVGHFAKDKYDSEFAKEWERALKEADLADDKADMTGLMATVAAVKDAKGVETSRLSAKATVNIWNNFRREIVTIIDKEKKVKHSRLAENLENAIKKLHSNGPDLVDSCYTPIIQSGGHYNLKVSAESDDKLLYYYGGIVTCLGARYNSYCSNVARTILFNPSKELEETYEFLVSVHETLIKAMKPGVRVCDAYEETLKFVATKRKDLVDKLVKVNFGFATGVEFRESTMLINSKCQAIIKPDMIFVIYLGLQNIENSSAKEEQGKKAAILLSDTIRISAEGDNEVLTESAKIRVKSNVVRIKEDEPMPSGSREDNKENSSGERYGRGKRSVVIQDQTRNKTTNEDKRKEKQKELGAQLNAAAQERLAGKKGTVDSKSTKRSTISYKNIDKFPDASEVDKLRVFVDKKHDTVILPIFGIPVPFHISMIKNTSMSVEGDYTYLRINFAHPGSQIGKETQSFPNPLATYVKEMSYRSSNVKEPGEITATGENLHTAFRLVKEMQKRYKTAEAEEREREGAVKQDKLILSTAKGNPKLKDLSVRPNIIQKKIAGTVEAHVNGFRYTSLRGDKIDVLYNNIKHAFFQPCDSEMIILLHFNLKNPVLWGKKKYSDIQFYTEVGEITTDLGKYHHMQDRDDIQSEHMEREMRKKLNQAFQNFCDKVVRQTNDAFDFDSPFNELGFYGVPFRSSCQLKPTSTCLVNLTEWPPFVVTLDEVELVHFERVSFSLKNFDMVFIFKDYSRKTQMVQQIPMSSLDSVKEWLNSCDIKYTEGIQSLNWAKIMKTILDDPEDFFANGGWNFLGQDSDAEGEDEEESEESEYNESEEEESGSDEDEEESGEETDDSESEGSLDSDESEGKDWSDLEEEARKSDKAKERDEIGGRDRGAPHAHSHSHSHHRKRKHESGGPPSKKRR
uniref:FACT complex subunit n=1 Tax=Steinernema glaseri TaxID=37863 RepID=A0A1I7YJM3_9BILA